MDETLNDAETCIDVYKKQQQPDQCTFDWRNPVAGLFLLYILAVQFSSRLQLRVDSHNDVTSLCPEHLLCILDVVSGFAAYVTLFPSLDPFLWRSLLPPCLATAYTLGDDGEKMVRRKVSGCTYDNYSYTVVDAMVMSVTGRQSWQ